MEKLTFEGGCLYPIYIAGLNIIGYVKNDSNEYWKMATDGNNQNSLFNLPILPIYYPCYSAIDYNKNEWH